MGYVGGQPVILPVSRDKMTPEQLRQYHAEWKQKNLKRRRQSQREWARKKRATCACGKKKIPRAKMCWDCRQEVRRASRRRNLHCAFCGKPKGETAASCAKCYSRFGLICTHNENCGVVGKHKHCPCHLAHLPEHLTPGIEPCGVCRQEMEHFRLTTLAELFTRTIDLEVAA